MNQSAAKQVKLNNPDKTLKLSTYITVSGVTLIILVKIWGWFFTGSVTILASLVDSLLDACVSTMNLLAVHYALQPADNQHRFGHGKVEDLAVFCQAIFFGVSGIWIIFTAISRFSEHHVEVIESGNISIPIMVFSIVVTSIILGFQHYAMSKSKSNVIHADSIHYFADFLANIIAIVGIFITTFWKIDYFDNITAIIIAIYIIYNTLGLFKQSINNLMDHELDLETRQIIIDIIKSHKQVKGFHDLKTRYAGVKPFIQFHIVLDENMILSQTHQVVTEIEKQILEKIPNAEIIMHQDPEGVEEEVFYID